MELHVSGHQQAINHHAIDRIHEKGMCALDKNKEQKGHKEEYSCVRAAKDGPRSRQHLVEDLEGGQGVVNVRKRTFQAEGAAGAQALGMWPV